MAAAKLFEKRLVEVVDIQSGLVLEPDWVANLPGGFNNQNSYVDFCAVDEEQMPWPFRCFTGYGAGDLVIKPAIIEGWGDFARHHVLKLMDKVIFYDNQGGFNAVPGRFVIHIRRSMRLFGVDITEAD